MDGIKYRKAEDMKNSGIEWIGRMPTDWQTIMIKRLSRIGRGASPRPIEDPKYFDDENGEYVWTRISDVTASEKYLKETEQKMSNLGANLSIKLEPNKLFLSIAGSVGKPCITGIKACIHDGFVYFPDLKGELTDYLYSVFNGQQCYKGLGKLGTQLNLNRETVGRIYIPISSDILDQQKIANFLDIKTAQFDSIISKKELLVKKLEQAKKSLISEVVTGRVKIMDGEMVRRKPEEMKDSHVKWLGVIPKDWQTIKLKRTCSLIKDGTHNPPPRVDDGYPLLSVRNIKNNMLTFLDDDSFISKEAFNIINRSFKVKENDVLLAIVGATIGKVAIANLKEQYTIQRSLAILRTREDMCNHRFLFYFVMSDYFQRLLWSNIGFSAQPGIYLGSLSNFTTILPGFTEQSILIDFLDNKVTKINSIIMKTESQIQYIRQAKQSLISEAVTGKIDLRDWEIIEEGELH